MINAKDKKIVKDEQGKKKFFYGRQYEWGFCDCYSDKYSDFNRLYKLIFSKNSLLLIFIEDCIWHKLIDCTNLITKEFKKGVKCDEFLKDSVPSQPKSSIKRNIAIGVLAGATIFLTSWIKKK